ncbi:DUF1232 domain-containing protein [Cyanobacterium aponinum AL20118]|uniref:DUF1232 domain-containing protein n=1 Tax=Cyanobacterium aponinum AL20115 TaxID=3090662 RepID=A0AAF0ZD26_9CHRO|nr:DUF1232 domain-containing protein [Cyanobacterium aponinum]PHV63914.1 hypothetical protein CSQ80_02490 [Cyanobacterium aponinum IPPAS B-1201]WPF88754.1 DUF1232 domain-containing protein [Cyanobacterium aponinum AL20115]
MKITPQAIYSLYSNAIRNPKYRNWIILGTLIYVLSPIDISPDIFPLAGQIDDFLLLSIMAIEVTQMVFNSQKKEEEKPAEKTVDVDAVSVE